MKNAIKRVLSGPVGSRIVTLYLQFVFLTSRATFVPAGKRRICNENGAVIYATWHGQNFILANFFRAPVYPSLLVARHGDGRMIGGAMANLGVPQIFGSGSTGKTETDKGGARAFLQMLRELRRGQSVVLTADIPKVAREVGEGIILLARKSGAPIVPVAMTSSRRKILGSWDKMQLNLPFSRIVYVEGDPIEVPQDDTPLAPYRNLLRDALDDAQARACARADKKR